MSTILPPRELVLASAGSGKTYRISSRLIGLFAVDEDPERVLASTFTRKAAGEILDRVLDRLARAAIDPVAARELAEAARLDGAHRLSADPLFWGQVLERTVRRLHRLNVGTLDAFFVRAAGAFEAELRLPPGWKIPDEPTARRLRSLALQEIFARSDRRGMVELLRLVARGDARRPIHDQLDSMLGELLEIEEQLDPTVARPWSAFRQARRGDASSPWSASPPDASPLDAAPGGALTVDQRETLARALELLELPSTASGSEPYRWRRAIEGITSTLRDGDWERLLKVGLCRGVASGDKVYDGVVIGPEMRGLVQQAITAAVAALVPVLAGQIEALGEIAGAYRDAYRSRQRREGVIDFDYLTRMIAGGDPLGDRADLYYRLDARTRHILLDEFQDTSLAQWEALAPIVDEVLSDTDRAGVIVADPKQSIYGWRGAEPGLVRAVGERYALTSGHLVTSWRSGKVVLDFVNSIFEGIDENPVLAADPACAIAAGEWVLDFRLHTAERDLPGYVSVEVGPEEQVRRSPRPLLCRRAAERVAELGRAAPGFTIGVLTRTNAAVARMFLELRQLDVDVSQEGGNPLTDAAPCEAVLALLRMVDHPGDSIARYHVAASPVGRALSYADHRDERGANGLAKQLRGRLLDDGYGATVTTLAKAIAPYCDAREVRRLAQLAELAHRHDSAATLRPTDFVRLAEAERVEDRAAADVRVMTIHQAKGLEFDIVVLPQLDDLLIRNGLAPALPLRGDSGGRITAVYPAAGRDVRNLFPELERVDRQRKAAIVRDGLSTLYVALTRARYAVHAVVPPDGRSGPGRAITPARIIREAVREGGSPLRPAMPGIVLHEFGRSDWYADPSAVPGGRTEPPTRTEPVRISLQPSGRARLLRRQTPTELHDAGAVEVGNLLRLDTTRGRERGSIVHAWFEQIRWIEDPVRSDADLLAVGRRVSPGTSPEELRDALEDLRRWIATPEIRRVLSRARYTSRTPTDAAFDATADASSDARFDATFDATPRVSPGTGTGGSVDVGSDAGSGAHLEVVVERELPFVQRRGESLLEGVIDRVVLVQRGGEVVEAEILDFKTDRLGVDRIPEMVERYRAQVAAYVEAVAAMYRVPREKCRATLVFLESRRAVEVEIKPQISQVTHR